MLAKIAPKTYQDGVHQRHRQAYIYSGRGNIEIYGTLKAALLLGKKLLSSLKKRGYVTNTHNWCVANKDIDVKQCTIVWYVDDLKISHQDPAVVDMDIASLSAKYDKIDKMTVRRGNKHEYLGMNLNFF